MKFSLQTIAIICGMLTIDIMMPFKVLSQTPTCPSFGVTAPMSPFPKSQVNQLVGGTPQDAGRRFEDFSRGSLYFNSNPPVLNNTRAFQSPARQQFAGIPNVVPDVVLPLLVVNPSGSQIFVDSVFDEVKAVIGTRLPPSYENHQIRGHIDHLGNLSPAGVSTLSGSIPEITFITTSDISAISQLTIQLAANEGVAVWHAIGCYENVPGRTRTYAQVSGSILLNPWVYLSGLSIPLSPRNPGTPVFFP
ncbi:hypothetical protein [Geitlerinema sp. PCC 7407]|uniref:hypothetical protein n=1 Tax=Geitlerinema sp. PCC 7407 TaxID=1173025 RepID=UPI00029FEEC9|nr:hypothetical protein [Geitlerinema sp. PCC 7407]AFY65926.1 hypothetical protein GEI7407_1433 [Geitlerinema sp. PCC 7407]